METPQNMRRLAAIIAAMIARHGRRARIVSGIGRDHANRARIVSGMQSSAAPGIRLFNKQCAAIVRANSGKPRRCSGRAAPLFKE
jgi:hypothetical protein